MKVLVLLIMFFSLPLYACIPCDKEIDLKLSHQSLPKFDKSYSNRNSLGTVVFKIDVSSRSKVESVNILEITPSDVPKSVVLDMIKRSKFTPLAPRDGFSQCGVKGYEFTMEFSLPQKINLDISL